MFHPDGPSFRELAVQALSSTERGYDLLAPKFDLTPFRTPQPLLDATRRCIEQQCGTVRQALDVCCGTGAGMAMLRPLCQQRLVGIDISRGMLQVADDALRASHPSDPGCPENCAVELIRGDALKMSFDSEFDLAVCFGALGHIRPPEEHHFAQRIFASLKPGGHFVFVTADPPPLLSWRRMVARVFNGLMHVRNVLIRPPFIMFYLTFLLPRARHVLETVGFEVTPFHGQLDGHSYVVVVARKPA